MVIRFYDFDFNLIHIEREYVSSLWNIRYNAEGTFEACFPNKSDVIAIVTENKYLVVKQGEFSAIITGYNAQDDFTVYGRTCNWLLKKRVILPFEEISDYSGSLACSLVSKSFSDVANFKTQNNSSGDIISFATDNADTAYNVVTKCLNEGGCGHEVEFDIQNKRWIFKTLGSNETELMISESLKNASDTSITADILDLCDCGYYKKSSAGENGELTEHYVLLQNGNKSGIYRWETVLSQRVESEAKASLNEKKENSTLRVSTHGIFYGSDYFLGDVVRVQIIKGVLKKTVKMKIGGVEVRYSRDTRFEQPIFEEV